MTTLLQISDTHFGTERPPVVNALLQLVKDLAPDVVVLSGDITQRARGTQFRAARKFADQLRPAALLAIPGNHDIPLFNLVARAFSPYANYSQAFGPNLEPEFETGNLLVIGVNTTRARRHKDGELSLRQIDRVAQRLQRATVEQLRIVVVHQPVIAIRASDEDNLLLRNQLAVPAWAAAGGDIIMGGHIHLPYVASMRSRFADLPRDMWAVQAGTAVSSRLRQGTTNSVNLIRTTSAGSGRRHCSYQRWDYVDVKARFELHSAEVLRFAIA